MIKDPYVEPEEEARYLAERGQLRFYCVSICRLYAASPVESLRVWNGTLWCLKKPNSSGIGVSFSYMCLVTKLTLYLYFSAPRASKVVAQLGAKFRRMLTGTPVTNTLYVFLFLRSKEWCWDITTIGWISMGWFVLGTFGHGMFGSRSMNTSYATP